MDTQITRTSTAITTLAAAAILAYKQEGITTAITRYGDAPIMFQQDERFIYKTLLADQIQSLPQEAQRRIQILNDHEIPYTDLIIAHERPGESLTRRLVKRVDRAIGEAAPILGVFLAAAVAAALIVTIPILAIGIVGAAIALGALGAVVSGVCGVDPIVFARLPTGEWLSIAMWYE